MLDIAPSEFMLIAFVALVVIGPKDLPKVMRVIGHWLGRARGVARQFRSGFDEMVRESELDEMEKRWASENERIMREHPAESTEPKAGEGGTQEELHKPVMVEKPVVVASADPDPAKPVDGRIDGVTS